MDHTEVREILEVAAAEPDGLERLMAGDTPDAAAVAGHLAGCEACTSEFRRLRDAAATLRDAIGSRPPDELRERTLAFVAAVGRPRGAPAGDASTATTARAAGSTVSAKPAPRFWSRPAVRVGWLAAAAVVLLVGAGLGWLAAPARDDGMARVLAHVTDESLRIARQPDARHVVLVDASGAGWTGRIDFSATLGEMAVVATGLPPAPAGHEYRCWVIVNGSRVVLGRMYAAGSLAYWVGTANGLDQIASGSVFGLSLVGVTDGSPSASPIMTGTL